MLYCGSVSRIGVALLLISPIFADAQQGFTIPDGTPVRMRMNRTISSAEAHTGDIVDFEVLDDIKSQDTILIPKGAAAFGTVTDAHPKHNMGRGGKLDVSIDFVRLSSGAKVALRGLQDVKGGGHTGAMTGAMVATSIVFFPAAPLFLFMKGKDITIPKGHEVTVFTNGETRVPPPSVQAASDATSPVDVPSGKALTNKDVLDMKAAGLSDELVIRKIQTSGASFTLETSDLIALHKAGMSDAIVSEMVRSNSRPSHASSR